MTQPPLPGLWVPKPHWRVWDRWREGWMYCSRREGDTVMVMLVKRWER